MDPQLIDRIYECCFVPDRWQAVLGDLATTAGAAHGWLAVSNPRVTHWAASDPRAAAVLQPRFKSGWILRQERFTRLLGSRHPGFLIDNDIYTPEELETDPSYRDLLRPLGLGWAAATAIPLPTGDNFAVIVERLYATGPVEPAVIRQLDQVRPHLARSALMAARLQFDRARMASETLGAIGLPALVLDDRAKVLAANHLIEALPSLVQWRARDQILLLDAGADRLLRAAMSTLDDTNADSVRSFPIRTEETTMLAHLLPIRRSARDIFTRCAAMLVLTPVTRPEAPPVELVRSLFDLTPAEARVARALAEGEIVDGIAAAGGVSPNTIRTHVRGVLEKTGCNRQSDVVALLTGIWSPPRTSAAPRP